MSYARGYRDSTVRTLMAYAVFGSPLRILNYSSATVRDPDGTGVPTGDSLQDNARRLNETVASVAGYLPPPSGSGLPPAPTGLSEQMTGTTTTLSWTAVAGANAYVVQGGTAPGDSGQFNSAVSGASFTRSLAPGTYYWRVRAQNSMGVGPGSPEATFTVAATNPVPGAPIGFASNVSGSTVTVSWSPPSSGGTVTSYDIEGGSSPGSAAYGHLTVAQSPQVFTNVPNGIFYLRVRAVGPAGASTPSADAVATVGALCAPPGISTLSTGMAGPTITLNWTTPSGTGPFTYVLAVGSGAGASNLGVYPMGGTNTVTATPPAGTYFVRVIAASACGVGGASSDLIVTVPPG